MKAKELINKAIEKLTELRVEQMKRDDDHLEQLSSNIDMLLCKAHDELTKAEKLPMSDIKRRVAA